MRAKELSLYLESTWPHIAGFLPEHKLVNVYADRIEGVHC